MAEPSLPKTNNQQDDFITLPFNQRIAYQQARIVVFLALIIGSLISGAQVTFDYFDKQQALNSNLSNIIQTSKRSASEALWTVNDRLAEGVIDGLFVYPPISSVVIKSDANFDLASRSRPDQAKQYQWLSEKIFGEKESHVIPLIAQNNGRRLGDIIITVDPHDEAIAFVKRSVVVFLFGIVRNFCLAAILFVAFYLTLTRPLLKVASFISNQDKEKPGQERIDPDELKHKGELKVIAKSLNNLLDSLGVRWSELAQAKEALDNSNKELEQRVKERTSELRETNSQLILEKDRADQASAAKGEFLANMSHEIRTPMNAVLGMIHLTKETNLTFQQQQYLEKAEAASKNLLHIINEILDFSKIEAGKLSLESKEFDISTVLDNISNIMSASAKDKKLDMYFDYFPKIPTQLQGDALRISQILINLTSNAIKFTEQGFIAVRIRLMKNDAHSCMLKFEVEDSGIGMSETQVAGIFDAFSQADSSTTRRFGGTGLGLAICKRLVSLMDGEVGVTSKPGTGSTFYFTATLGLASEAHQPTKLEEFSNVSAIIFDDYTNSQKTLSSILQYHGMTVNNQSNVELILESFTSTFDPNNTPSCIFIDQDKVESIGLENTRKLISLFTQKQSTKVILLASHPSELPVLIKEINPSHVITKPFTEYSIRQALSALYDIEVTDESSSQDNHQQEVDLNGKSILLVEDDEINQIVAQEILANIGINVSLANNGKEALDILTERQGSDSPFDLVLMDVQMPIMDGYEATRKIREHDFMKTLPVLAMTASVLAEDIQSCMDAGMDSHVSKPIDLEELYATLQKWTRAKTSPEA